MEDAMKKILVINGPNLNLLGLREPEIYGKRTYADLVEMIRTEADLLGVSVEFVQSNHEGALVDAIQGAYGAADGIVINPGAYTHTSVALLDAVKAVGIPTVEVHISDPDKREEFRRISYIRAACVASIQGHGLAGYLEALRLLAK
jgi:3-dehydroquinate dehydratase type II